MSLLNFHASELYRQVSPCGSYDGNGDFRPCPPKWEFCCRCDVVPAGEANKIVIPDGTIDFYSYMVYNLPVSIRKFEYGDFVKLILLGNEEVIVKVKGFHRYQLQCKLWA